MTRYTLCTTQYDVPQSILSNVLQAVQQHWFRVLVQGIFTCDFIRYGFIVVFIGSHMIPSCQPGSLLATSTAMAPKNHRESQTLTRFSLMSLQVCCYYHGTKTDIPQYLVLEIYSFGFSPSDLAVPTTFSTPSIPLPYHPCLSGASTSTV